MTSVELCAITSAVSIDGKHPQPKFSPRSRTMFCHQSRWWSVGLGLLLMVALSGCGADNPGPASAKTTTPNVVVVLLDDVGIDQWQIFGYGGVLPAPTPNIAAIAQHRVM